MEQQISLPVRIAVCGLQYYLETASKPLEESPPIAALLAHVEQEGSQAEQVLLAHLRTRSAGVFVSYHTRANDELRGCIGTIEGRAPNIVAEICRNTVSAGTEDPRFRPIVLDELPQLTCSVDILGETESIDTMSELDAKRYGVIVSRGWRRGLLLPDLEGVDTVEHQVSIALAKAGIHPTDSYRMERFEVIRYA